MDKNEEKNVKTDEKKEYKISWKKFAGLFSDKKKILIISICMAIIIIFLLLFSTIFALININSTNIINGIKVNQFDISKLSKEEAEQKLEQIVQEKTTQNLKIVAQDFEYQLNLSQIEVQYNINEVVNQAYSIGRDSNIFVNNYQILKTMMKNQNINLKYTYNEELLDNMLADIESKIPNAVVEPSYYICPRRAGTRSCCS